MRAADMLQRCMEVRLSRRHGSGWPATCRNAGCVWCGPSTARRRWRGIERWITEDDAPVSLAVLPLGPGRGVLRRAVAHLRRALRDVRDRAARRDRRWRGVAIAGMASADGTALLLIRHPGVGRAEVAEALCRRWPGAVVGVAGSLSPSWEMRVEDAVELARARRGAASNRSGPSSSHSGARTPIPVNNAPRRSRAPSSPCRWRYRRFALGSRHNRQFFQNDALNSCNIVSIPAMRGVRRATNAVGLASGNYPEPAPTERPASHIILRRDSRR